MKTSRFNNIIKETSQRHKISDHCINTKACYKRGIDERCKCISFEYYLEFPLDVSAISRNYLC